MLLIRTKHDIQTHYLFNACSPVIKVAETKGLNVIKVEDNVTKENVSKRLAKIKPKFVFYNGHGTPTAFLNHNKEEVINLESAKLLKGTIVFARACDSVSVLGKKAVDEGCKAFVGYN